ncbi:hypothetical protein [Clostridium omnivorum]|uniref:Serpin domain-containing protein n=1 Tax=Clostridium omnivorum TaxID=1604902 RepID=A0ABQ5N3Y2_9CLOT|nr:hypothetical protein [Clostridium sp. E14]GLC29914.1 hypothetical protein bsdE14_13240 [Clostridium sp. E14]
MKGIKLTAILFAVTITFSGCSLGHKTKQTDSSSFENLTITPHMEEQIKGDKNILYCSTFQLAWNELKDNIIKGDIRLSGSEPGMVKYLNKELSTKKDLSDKDYVAMAGFGKDEIVKKINDELKSKFKDQAPTVAEQLKQDDIFAYAFLYKNLKFQNKFEKLKQTISFSGSTGVKGVKGFGIIKYKDSTSARKVAEQVTILDYKNDNDFIIKLKSNSPKDEIILAKLKPEQTLLETIKAVEERSKTSSQSNIAENDTLQIPCFDFNIDHNYTELLDKPLMNSGFEDYEIVKAKQNVLFKLNETGATLKSEVKITMTKSAPMVTHRLVFDKPFLLMLKEKDAAYPYFAIWVQNAELLVNN